MRSKPSEKALKDLDDILFSFLTQYGSRCDIDPLYCAQQLRPKIEEWYCAQHTFTDWIKDSVGWYRYCPTCDRRYAADKIPFPVTMMRYLHLLAFFNKPMTVKEIERESGIERRFDESSHFPTLKHWQLIEAREGNRYAATEKARRVLAQQEGVEEWIWRFKDTRLVPPPPDEADGLVKLTGDIKHTKFDWRDIMDNSVSAFLLT